MTRAGAIDLAPAQLPERKWKLSAQQTPEASIFHRYKALFEDALRIRGDIKELDKEAKDLTDDAKHIKRLASLAAKDAVNTEIAKFTSLRKAADECGQGELFS